MSGETLPDDQALIAFTSQDGKKREGFYSDDLGLFIETTGNSANERTGATFGPGEITSWDYIADDRPNSDIMVIL